MKATVRNQIRNNMAVSSNWSRNPRFQRVQCGFESRHRYFSLNLKESGIKRIFTIPKSFYIEKVGFMANSNIVSKATTYLRSLSRKRVNRVVTADDVQNFLTRNGFRGDLNERLSVVRQVLRSPNFYAVGTTRSKREEARSRTITAWTA